MIRAEWSDMLGRSHSEIDCYGVVLEYYKRAGISLPTREQAMRDPAAAAAKFLFREVSGSPEEGDVIQAWDTHPELVEHVGVVVSERRLLHSSIARGCVALTPLRHVEPKIIRILRYAPSALPE